MKVCDVLCCVALAFLGATLASADCFQAGGDCLVVLQNEDGGWDWPLLDDDYTQSDAPNILAPVGMGLLHAYHSTGDPVHLQTLMNAGRCLLNKSPQQITPDDGYFAVALDATFGVSTYTDYVKANFYDPLAAGTYDFLGDGTLLVDAEWYVFTIRMWRAYEGLANLAALDCGTGLYSAALIGADTSAWIEGTKAEVNELDGADAFDVLGLAGALLGLASVGEEIDPTEGTHAAAASLADLGAILAGYQLSTGGFTWNSQNMAEGAVNETVQETAFAILALDALDAGKYEEAIAVAATYLESVQLSTGGWEVFLGQGENNEMTGESLWALGIARPTQTQEP